MTPRPIQARRGALTVVGPGSGPGSASTSAMARQLLKLVEAFVPAVRVVGSGLGRGEDPLIEAEAGLVADRLEDDGDQRLLALAAVLLVGVGHHQPARR